VIGHVVTYIQVLQLTKLAELFKDVFVEILKRRRMRRRRSQGKNPLLERYVSTAKQA
jgi:hypothetical protein